MTTLTIARSSGSYFEVEYNEGNDYDALVEKVKTAYHGGVPSEENPPVKIIILNTAEELSPANYPAFTANLTRYKLQVWKT